MIQEIFTCDENITIGKYRLIYFHSEYFYCVYVKNSDLHTTQNVKKYGKFASQKRIETLSSIILSQNDLSHFFK